MKLVLFSGDHPRHLFINRELVKYFDEVLVIIMRRERIIPSPPAGLSNHDIELFKVHFANRHKVELEVYGDLCVEQAYGGNNIVIVEPNELNKERLALKIKEFNADFCFIFGVDLILEPVIDELPKDKINLHLGLSPWYKGGATLYWPFYHLQPQFCGVTFHQITQQADAGEIIHQCVPVLESGDGIHDVGAKCVLQARSALHKMISYWISEREFEGQIQKTSGRNWRGIDFHASQLRIIYDLFNDRIVDHYLSGEFGSRKPKIFSCINN